MGEGLVLGSAVPGGGVGTGGRGSRVGKILLLSPLSIRRERARVQVRGQGLSGRAVLCFFTQRGAPRGLGARVDPFLLLWQ